MAGIVLLLMFSDGFGQEEGAPVGEGADDTAVLEEEGAGLAGDPGERDQYGLERRKGSEDELGKGCIPVIA